MGVPTLGQKGTDGSLGCVWEQGVACPLVGPFYDRGRGWVRAR